jgi:hypothetical protein
MVQGVKIGCRKNSKKIQKKIQKHFGRTIWPEFRRKIFSGGAFGWNFGRKILSPGVHRHFFQKIVIFLFCLYWARNTSDRLGPLIKCMERVSSFLLPMNMMCA